MNARLVQRQLDVNHELYSLGFEDDSQHPNKQSDRNRPELGAHLSLALRILPKMYRPILTVKSPSIYSSPSSPPSARPTSLSSSSSSSLSVISGRSRDARVVMADQVVIIWYNGIEGGLGAHRAVVQRWIGEIEGCIAGFRIERLGGKLFRR